MKNKIPSLWGAVFLLAAFSNAQLPAPTCDSLTSDLHKHQAAIGVIAGLVSAVLTLCDGGYMIYQAMEIKQIKNEIKNDCPNVYIERERIFK